RANTTTQPWFRSPQLRTPDGSVAKILRERACEAWRRHRKAAMTWVSARYAQLIKLCRSRGCSREIAKEVVQEAYLRLFDYQRSAKVKDAESLVRRIALNLAINYYQ